MTVAARPSLAELLDPAVLADPYPLYQRLRENDPVGWEPYLHAWVVTSYADVVTVLHSFSADRAPSAEKLAAIGLAELSPIADVMVRQMLFLDAPSHTRLRRLAAHAFSPARVAVLREHVAQIVDGLLERVEACGGLDIIADVAHPLPSIVTAEMLGVPLADAPQLTAWSKDFAEVLGNFQQNPERAPQVLQSLRAMIEYFAAAIAQDERRPGPGLIRSFLAANVDGDRFTPEEIVANVILTMVGGQETTTNLIANGMLTLFRNPGEHARLRADLTLLPAAVEEMLRFEPPSQQTARLAPDDRELGGKRIAKGQAVIAVMAAANRDPARFPDPDRFDITRTDNRHLSFGWGAHFCFGAALARIEAQVAFERLLRRFPRLRAMSDDFEAHLEWRTNLGLRGLTSLPVAF